MSAHVVEVFDHDRRTATFHGMDAADANRYATAFHDPARGWHTNPEPAPDGAKEGN